ncbi:MAG: gamma-glutamyltransferase family protein [Paracoccaceae bacterium]
MTFTTRPEITGTFGVVTSTHWIASAVGMSMLERGGNAFDAAVATGFVLQVVEPHLNGPLGDLPALIWPAGATAPTVICGQGPAPAAATITHYRSEGLELIPASGLLATVIPGAFDAWMLMLRDHGRLSLREVLEPAIYYAEQGHPVLPGVSRTIAGLSTFFSTEWPTSANIWMPGGTAPEPGTVFKNPALANTWTRLLNETDGVKGREAQIDAARDQFYRGFIAEAVDSYLKTACVADSTGDRRKGVLTGQDMAGYSATYEAPRATDYAGWSVWKTDFWGQGPSLLQSLNTLNSIGIDTLDPAGPDFVHLIAETLKLSFADREAYYGDPTGFDIPFETLLSMDYAATRSALLNDTASTDQRPGHLPGLEHLAEAAIARAARHQASLHGIDAGEPTMAHLRDRRGDTVHLDVIDTDGNMVSATPSGGWLQSSPVVPGLGMPLNSRAQMFWLDPGLPTSLAPGRRPRTTLSPSMAQGPTGMQLAFGTPGGDQQDQWQLILFLRLAHGTANLQAAIDSPLFHTGHNQSSFYPRVAQPGHLMIEASVGEPVLDALRARGHHVEVADPWTVGRLTAATRDPDGLMRAGATPRLMQAYAIGR